MLVALKRTMCLLAGLSPLVATAATAQVIDLEDPATGSAARTPGEYAGVKPGGAELPAITATPGATPATVTWPGFQMMPDGSSRVFLQTTSAVPAQMATSAREVVIDLGDAKVAGSTNALPLDTRFFNTPVTRISLRKEKGRLQLVLSLRAAATPSVTSERATSGFHFLYVDFAAGNYLGHKAATPAPPSPDEPAPPAPAARVQVDRSMDSELPPGMGQVKASGSAGATAKPKGKTGGKASGKAGGKVGLSF